MAKKKKLKPVRRGKRHMVRRGGLKERLKEAARLRPFSVDLSYKGYNREFDRALFAAAGSPSHGSGYGGGWRDHSWITRTAKEAREIAEKLSTMPGLERLVMSEDVKATLEIIRVEELKKLVGKPRRLRAVRRKRSKRWPSRRPRGNSTRVRKKQIKKRRS